MRNRILQLTATPLLLLASHIDAEEPVDHEIINQIRYERFPQLAGHGDRARANGGDGTSAHGLASIETRQRVDSGQARELGTRRRPFGIFRIRTWMDVRQRERAHGPTGETSSC